MSKVSVIDVDTLLCRLIASLDVAEFCDGRLDTLALAVGACAIAGPYWSYAQDGREDS